MDITYRPTNSSTAEARKVRPLTEVCGNCGETWGSHIGACCQTGPEPRIWKSAPSARPAEQVSAPPSESHLAYTLRAIIQEMEQHGYNNDRDFRVKEYAEKALASVSAPEPASREAFAEELFKLLRNHRAGAISHYQFWCSVDELQSRWQSSRGGK